MLTWPAAKEIIPLPAAIPSLRKKVQPMTRAARPPRIGRKNFSHPAPETSPARSSRRFSRNGGGEVRASGRVDNLAGSRPTARHAFTLPQALSTVSLAVNPAAGGKSPRNRSCRIPRARPSSPRLSPGFRPAHPKRNRPPRNKDSPTRSKKTPSPPLFFPPRRVSSPP